MVLADKWSKSHQRLASKEIMRIKKTIRKKNLNKSLPDLSKNYLEWISQARPIVEGKPRDFVATPFWVDIYNDTHSFKMIVGGRQIYKSTYTTDVLACEATSAPGVQVCYVTFDQPSQNSFSKQKLQIGTFSQNPVLSKFPRNKLGNIGEISLKNSSTIYCTTDNYEYRHVEGKSLNHCILDEAQYQEIQHLSKVNQTMMATKGKITILGIGGESGSPYESLWKKTDQREWFYDDPNWRDKLQFNENGLVVGEYLKKVLKGKWIAQKPENSQYHGYHIPQTIFATIPLRIDDAITKYKIHSMYSIEYQQKNNPNHIFSSHTMGEFYRADRRPITPEMVYACMNPYRYFGLMSTSEISSWKDVMQDRVKISMGVDFGSGNPSNTVISIIIHWKESDRLQLAYLDKRPQENQIDQAEYINKLFKESKCDVGVGDLGYGTNQIKLIQDGGANRLTGQSYSGVGSSMFIGCRTAGDETKPMQVHPSAIDEHGEQSGRITIDKTTSIQEFVDVIGTFKSHPTRLADDSCKRTKFMIPYLAGREHETEWLVKDFTALTRKDLENTVNLAEDPRQRAKKEFNHPKDSLMSIIYAMTGLKQNVSWHWVRA